MWKTVLTVIVVAALALVAFVYFAGRGGLGSHEEPGEPTAALRPPAGVERETRAVDRAASAIGVPQPKQVLFGDFHVHTTFSPDAFMLSLPAAVGEGAHPPADACDFARFCSALDFWSINDHAEGIEPADTGSETVESIRQCNDVAGRPDATPTYGGLPRLGVDPGRHTPEDHYGHKNVVLRDHREPIGCPRVPSRALSPHGVREQTTHRLPRWGLASASAKMATSASARRLREVLREIARRSATPDCESATSRRPRSAARTVIETARRRPRSSSQSSTSGVTTRS